MIKILTIVPPVSLNVSQCHVTFLLTFQKKRQAPKSDLLTSSLLKKSINPIGYMRREQSRWRNIHGH